MPKSANWKAFRKRRDFMVQGIGESLQQEIAAPEGAFYLFAPVSTVFGKRKPNGTVVKDSLELCQYILESQGLAIVPGAAFGDDSCIRFSYAASDENLKQARIRFNKAIADLK